MRLALLIATTALFTMLAYLYHTRSSPETMPPAPSTSAATLHNSGLTPQASNAEQQRVTEQQTIALPARPSLVVSKHKPAHDLRVGAKPDKNLRYNTRLARDSDIALRNAMSGATTPAHKTVQAQGPSHNPKDLRWIRELSGQRASLNMHKSRLDQSCVHAENCSQRDDNTDIKLAGVRVQTARLAKTPQAPLSGTIKRGHFAQGTPAVYVE